MSLQENKRISDHGRFNSSLKVKLVEGRNSPYIKHEFRIDIPRDAGGTFSSCRDQSSRSTELGVTRSGEPDQHAISGVRSQVVCVIKIFRVEGVCLGVHSEAFTVHQWCQATRHYNYTPKTTRHGCTPVVSVSLSNNLLAQLSYKPLSREDRLTIIISISTTNYNIYTSTVNTLKPNDPHPSNRSDRSCFTHTAHPGSPPICPAEAAFWASARRVARAKRVVL